MKQTTNFRARVMKYAYQIWLSTRQTWSLCMKKAWQVYKLGRAMRERTVRFAYRKIDGTIRQASGTFLPGTGKKGKPSYKTLAYFDIDKQQFRCFRIENLISFD